MVICQQLISVSEAGVLLLLWISCIYIYKIFKYNVGIVHVLLLCSECTRDMQCSTCNSR